MGGMSGIPHGWFAIGKKVGMRRERTQKDEKGKNLGKKRRFYEINVSDERGKINGVVLLCCSGESFIGRSCGP